MNFRNISSWCIRNPVPPIVLFVGLMLAGLVAFSKMEVNNFPDIDVPAAIVTVVQPGAAPNEMESQVTQRIESAIRGVNGVDEINSTVSEGNSSTFVQFEIGTPTDVAINDVRNAIGSVEASYLAAAFEAVGEEYGDLETYLRDGLKLGAAERTALKERYLQT